MKAEHIVIINDFAHVNGGAGQVALGSALALAERGHAVTVFSAVGPVSAELRAGRIKLICTDQQEIARDNNRFRASIQGLWNREAARRLESLLQSLPRSGTIVHIHGFSKSLSSSVSRTATAMGFPTVLTMHDYFLACPNGGFYNYRTRQICDLQPMSPACLLSQCDKRGYGQKLWRSGRQVIQSGIGRMPDGIRDFIAISDFSRRILAPHLPKQARVHLVGNPIAVEKRAPVKVSSNHTPVFVGRLEPEKGAILLARAAHRAGLGVTFVGEGSQREEILRESPQSTVTGWLEPTGVQVQLESARCLVLPSRWYETQGLVVLEAAARGVPAIVPDQCAASDFVDDGVTGLIFRTGDMVDLEQKLRQLADPDLAVRLGGAAYEKYWQAPTTMASHTDRLVAVYESMLARPAGKATAPETISLA